jgi:hypothetical protein
MERQFHFMPYEVIYRLSAHYWELLYHDEPFRSEWIALIKKRRCYPRVNLNLNQQHTLLTMFMLLKDYPTSSLFAEVSEATEKFLSTESAELQDLYELYLAIHRFSKTHLLPAPILASVEQDVIFAPASEERRLLKGNLLMKRVYVSPAEGRPTHPQLPDYEPLRETREAYRERVLQVLAQYAEEMEDFYRNAGWKGWNTLSSRLREDYLKTLAKRVFLRVMVGASWSEIAAATNCTASTACETTREGIRLLHIPYHSDTK